MPITDFGNIAECGVTSLFIPSFFFSIFFNKIHDSGRKKDKYF